MKNRGIRLQSIFFLTILLIAGCNTSDGVDKTSLLSLIKTTDPPPLTAKSDPNEENTVRKIKEEVLSNEKIYDAAIIKGKSDVLVAYKVKHLHRFRMKQIEGEVKKRLENEFENENFTISSDFKIFLEAIKLQKKSEQENLSEEEIDRQLKKIIKLSKEQT
ncbi:YhcN/YlaJ family sporulation lipoprotein [Fervidibacillus albus]|uniref:YhcN/YlaJ family sporulation lipoprotein n=1 Tax=Fervidibacillus albus TaxID=2980026 RepID=A0A9E8LSZ6_9BACI|nr:YhcN/YlaJ family sporulation lipoprotein [Fervidibacillus albus]WAA08636.1 YhcN/YlaJ family sporulation lipoprotein [Fervidibacillus albus]